MSCHNLLVLFRNGLMRFFHDFSLKYLEMSENSNSNDDKVVLPHHEQQELCTTRLPYRQGRKLTAIKVYTINNESNHLLIFGVPSLNLRQEAKALFLKFGRLKSFNLAKDYKSEQFTETYHAAFEKIQSARMAKKMLDTKNFYGGSLHIAYAPELEDLDETNTKLLQRKHDVLARLRNLQKEVEKDTKKIEVDVIVEKVAPKLNMAVANIIHHDGTVRKRKHKDEKQQFMPCFIENEVKSQEIDMIEEKRAKFITNEANREKHYVSTNITKFIDRTSSNVETVENSNIEIIDCTSADLETVTNVDGHSGKTNEGNKIYKVPKKPLNKIKFYVNKKS